MSVGKYIYIYRYILDRFFFPTGNCFIVIVACPTVLKSEKVDFTKNNFDYSTTIWFLEYGNLLCDDLKKLQLVKQTEKQNKILL